MSLPTPLSAYSPAEVWYWNGMALSQPYWNIATFGGSRFGVPTLRGQNVQVPYRSGQAQQAKYLDQRTITLTMWLNGAGSAAGWQLPADQRLAFNNNWQQLRQAFLTRNAGGSVQGQLQRNWYLTQAGTPQLVTSTAMAEIAGSMDPTMNGRVGAALSVDLLLSDPYFYGAARSQGITGTAAVSALGEGVVGEGFPSPVSSFTVTLSAPATVTNTSAGVAFTVGTGPAFPVVVDCLNYTVTDSAGKNQVFYFSHAGSRLWMALVPGSNTINVSAGTATFAWNDTYV
jgi:hypothetical protein